MELENNIDQCKVEIVTIGAAYEVLNLPDYEPINENGTIKLGSNLALKIIPLEEMDDTLVLTVTVIRNGIEEDVNIDSEICYIIVILP